MTGKCATCRFWRPLPRERLLEYEGLWTRKQRDAIREWLESGPVFGTCAHDKLIYCDLPDTPDGLSYSDNECYAASLVVGRDFGCVHHEP